MQVRKSDANLPDRFDPFSDRRARDIRNSISEAFIQALAGCDRAGAGVKSAANKWLEKTPQAIYREYIHKRLECYQRVIERICAMGLGDPRQQALMIWNEGLFFEVHEHLETIWQKTAGPEREAFKGLIQAAGFFVHMQRGHLSGATRLAAKSAALIRRYRDRLTFIANLDVLLESLDKLNPVAPQLEFPAPLKSGEV